MTSDQADILALYGVPGVGAKTFAFLLSTFGTAGDVFSAAKHELMAHEGIGNATADNILSFDRETFVREQERLMDETGTHMLVRGYEAYPSRLDAFKSAPPILFVRGDHGVLNTPSVAVVGTRRATPYGVKMTRALVAEAVRSGITIISGMADGIDTIAHRTALEEDGLTAAVFGCGADIIYPTGNTGLARSIEKTGCLVSHFPMGLPGAPGNFPARNAVVVGLTLATIVVEAPKKSGALITADMTLKTGHPLFAVPGPADARYSEGTNALFAKGASPVSSFDTVNEAIGRRSHEKKLPGCDKPLPEGTAGDILGTLSGAALHVDEIASKLNISVSSILTELTMLEIDGLVAQRPGKMYERM